MRKKKQELVQLTAWMGVPELGKYLGVSKESIYRWLKSGSVPAHRVGKIWKFDPLEVDAAIKKGKLEND